MKIRSKKISFLIVLAFIIFMIAECASRSNVTPGAASGKYVEIFFLSENSHQYFVRPIEWKDDDILISIDFTVRTHKKSQPNDPVAFSYTLEKNTPFHDEPAVYFVLNDTTAIAPSMIDQIASEDNNCFVKYSSQIEYHDFITMLYAKRVEIIILDGMNDSRIKVPKKFYKAASELKTLLKFR